MATKVAKSEEKKTANVPATRDPLSAMRSEMNDLISRIWYGHDEGPTGLALNAAMDLSETDNAFEIRVDAPGIAPEKFDIQVQGNSVTVSGKREEEHEEKGKTFHRVERRKGTFSRTLTLPCDVNEDEVAAQYTDGVLTLTLPKSEKSRVKKIRVHS